MTTKRTVVRNKNGIHVRPSRAIVTAFGFYPGSIEITANDMTIDALSIMHLLALGMQQDDEVTVTVTGPDEEATASRLADLIAAEFNFPPASPLEMQQNISEEE